MFWPFLSFIQVSFTNASLYNHVYWGLRGESSVFVLECETDKNSVEITWARSDVDLAAPSSLDPDSSAWARLASSTSHTDRANRLCFLLFFFHYSKQHTGSGRLAKTLCGFVFFVCIWKCVEVESWCKAGESRGIVLRESFCPPLLSSVALRAVLCRVLVAAKSELIKSCWVLSRRG